MYVLAPNNIVEKFPYSLMEFRKSHPQTSFPSRLSDDVLAPYGVFPVVSVAAAYDSSTQVAEPSGCSYANNQWSTAWAVRSKTAEELTADADRVQRKIVASTQQRLDDFAKTRNYDGILSACTYATSPTAQFSTEGQYAVEARDATWAKLYQILAEVQAGTRPMPSGYADIESELPVLAWPSV